MLEVREIHAYYGESHILHGVSLAVAGGRVVALLGRNGAGKTTTLRAIMGLTPARRGQIRFDGKDITREPAFAIARAGIGFIPAGRRLFGGLTVLQNLYLGAAMPGRSGGAWTLERIYSLFPKLETLAGRPARTLSGGEQQMLKFGRCLLGEPRLLLLDEPTEGLAPNIVRQLIGTLRSLKEAGVPMLICEQNARFALGIADDAYLLEKGVIRYSGNAAELSERPELKEHLSV
ncbi:MAG: ABC transporter ATP-binding protein [Acetobacteraceae bacterium]